MKARDISINRANELRESIKEFSLFKQSQQALIENRSLNHQKLKQKILNFYNASPSDWDNWQWQLNNRIKDVSTLEFFIKLTDTEKNVINEVIKTNRFAISPYYMSLIVDSNDPIWKLSIPSIDELLSSIGESDPMDEKNTNPAGAITRRYPDRLIINVTNQCAMYCRHCQRRRLIGQKDTHTNKALIDESILYIKQNQEIRDVLLTGGDTLLLSDSSLEYILKELRKIPHVEIIRIGSRTPVTIPMRITDDLVNMIKKYHPVYLNTHFNHYFEITPQSKEACEKLNNAGISVGNQAVLLKGINDTPFSMTLLNQKLLHIRVRPYYIFHAKNVIGTIHFVPKLSDGLKIMEFMRGHTSGMAIPTYIINAPKGLGKVPLLPKYITNIDEDTYSIRTWENKTFIYKEKS